MKKALSFLMFVLLINTIANAQYEINRTKYDYRTYTYQKGDRYNPEMAGFISGLVPGLGQVTSGETGRGLLFFGGSVGSWIVLFNAIPEISPSPSASTRRAIVGGIGVLGLWLWSIGDAQRVAKVNSLAWRDKNKSSMNLEILPDIGTMNYADTEKITTGISLRINF